MAANTKPGPCLLIIFGASGDLTKRKLIPSLYHLHNTKQLPEGFAVMGVSRTKMSDDDFRGHITEAAKEFIKDLDEVKWREFCKCVHYHAGDSTKAGDYPAANAVSESMDVVKREA